MAGFPLNDPRFWAFRETIAALRGSSITFHKSSVELYKTSIEFYRSFVAFYKSSAKFHEVSIEFYKCSVELYKTSVAFYKSFVELYKTSVAFYKSFVELYKTSIEFYRSFVAFYKGSVELYGGFVAFHESLGTARESPPAFCPTAGRLKKPARAFPRRRRLFRADCLSLFPVCLCLEIRGPARPPGKGTIPDDLVWLKSDKYPAAVPGAERNFAVKQRDGGRP